MKISNGEKGKWGGDCGERVAGGYYSKQNTRFQSHQALA